MIYKNQSAPIFWDQKFDNIFNNSFLLALLDVQNIFVMGSY